MGVIRGLGRAIGGVVLGVAGLLRGVTNRFSVRPEAARILWT